MKERGKSEITRRLHHREWKTWGVYQLLKDIWFALLSFHFFAYPFD